MRDKFAGGAALAALALFLLCLPALMEAPEAEAPLTPSPAAARLAVLAAAPAPQGEEGGTPRSVPGPRPQALMAEPPPRVFAPLRDSNGHPLLRRAYVKAVYRAFPPERWPG